MPTSCNPLIAAVKFIYALSKAFSSLLCSARTFSASANAFSNTDLLASVLLLRSIFLASSTSLASASFNASSLGSSTLINAFDNESTCLLTISCVALSSARTVFASLSASIAFREASVPYVSRCIASAIST